MGRRRAGTSNIACRRHLAAGLILAVGGLLAACSSAPYQIEAETDPPWELLDAPVALNLDPPLSERAYRINLCYGNSVNDEAEILALAEEICDGGRLVLEDQNDVWNGCSVLQPTRVTYICDPPAEAAAGN